MPKVTNPLLKEDLEQRLGEVFTAINRMMTRKYPNIEVRDAEIKMKAAQSLLDVKGHIKSGELSKSCILHIGITNSERGVRCVSLQCTEALIACLLQHLSIDAGASKNCTMFVAPRATVSNFQKNILRASAPLNKENHVVLGRWNACGRNHKEAGLGYRKYHHTECESCNPAPPLQHRPASRGTTVPFTPTKNASPRRLWSNNVYNCLQKTQTSAYARKFQPAHFLRKPPTFYSHP